MKVIFIKDFPGVARAGTVKDVSEGYARNFLFPKKVAEPATDAKIAEIENLNKQKTASADRAREKLTKLAGRNWAVHFSRKADKAGSLFAGVTSAEIARALTEKSGVEFQEKWVKLEHPLKKTGEHVVDLDLNHKAIAKVKVKIESI